MVSVAARVAPVAIVALLVLSGVAATTAVADGPAGDESATGERTTPGSLAPEGQPAAGAPDADVEAPSSASATVTATGGRASVTGTASAVANAPTNLTVTQQLRLTPETPGSVDVRIRYDVPDRLTTLETTVPETVTVLESDGFSRVDGRTYEWNGESSPATVTYSLAVNETRELAGPEGGPGEYLFVDAGDWALFRRPAVATSWGWRGGAPVGLSRESTTAGSGFVGDWIVYMGEHRTHERRAHGQQFRLVVPERAAMAESPDAILDALTAASDRLRVGDRDDRVTALAAPTTDVQWGVRGLQFGEADVWVRDVEELGTVENTWLHEYVHTRQDYETAPGARWTTEGFATYYAALLAVEGGHADLSTLGPYLGRGTSGPQASAVLAEPSTWTAAAEYLKGSLVAGDVDRRIRVATDSERSLQAVFSALNAHRTTVDRAAVESAVAEAGDESVRSALVEFATTPRRPEMWSRSTHEAVFGTTPALVGVGYADDADAFAVSGPYRNVTVRPEWRVGQTTEGPRLSLYAGETLTARATVLNAGDAATEYEARFAVDERVVDSRSGSIRPDETATHTFERTFERSGQHVVAVGSDEVAVEVFEPATANVTAVRANRTALLEPGAVELVATVTNDHAAPSRTDLTLSVANETVFDRTVSLGPNAEREVASTVRLSERGEYTITLGDAPDLTIIVGGGGGGGGGSGGDGSSSFGPGFGALVALVGILLAIVLGGRHPD